MTSAIGAPLQLRYDSGLAAPGEAPLQMAVDVFLPPAGQTPRALLWCLPGGNMNRHYYDLIPPAKAEGGDLLPPAKADGGDLMPAVDGDDNSFSFARTFAAQGFVVASVDYLGLGDSSRPADGWRCTPEFLTQANQAAYTQLQAQLSAGRLHADLPPQQLPSIGVGHSMGAMMTTLQQAAHQVHAGIALLGFSTRGLPEYVPAALRGEEISALRPRLVELARQMFGEPYPVIKGGSESRAMFAGRSADPRGVAALKRVATNMLAIPAFLSMLPGNVAPEARQITVPVFLGLGENDMAGPTHVIPAAFSASADVQLHIAAGAGHAQFLFASRGRLMRRIADWIADTVL